MYVYYLLLCGMLLPGIFGWELPESWGFRTYSMYEHGNMNLIITAPHGGQRLEPVQSDGTRWPDRKAYGCKGSNGECIWTHSCERRSKRCKAGILNDLYTEQIARDIVDEIEARTGEGYPT